MISVSYSKTLPDSAARTFSSYLRPKPEKIHNYSYMTHVNEGQIQSENREAHIQRQHIQEAVSALAPLKLGLEEVKNKLDQMELLRIEGAQRRLFLRSRDSYNNELLSTKRQSEEILTNIISQYFNYQTLYGYINHEGDAEDPLIEPENDTRAPPIRHALRNLQQELQTDLKDVGKYLKPLNLSSRQEAFNAARPVNLLRQIFTNVEEKVTKALTDLKLYHRELQIELPRESAPVNQPQIPMSLNILPHKTIQNINLDTLIYGN